MNDETEYESLCELCGDTINIIMKIPRETVLLNTTVTIIDKDGKLHQAEMAMSPGDIREARQDFLNNVELGDDYDTVITLTDKGREMLKHMDSCEDGICDSIGFNDLGGE